MAEVVATRAKQQKPAFELLQFLRSYQVLKFSTSFGVPQEKLKNCPEKKVLKVAIMGRPNAGKSTLVNEILKLRLCGVSSKSHTTKTPFRAAFTRGDTQVVFVDTPGLVTRKEHNRFHLPDDFLKWKEKVLDEVDLIGVIHEATEPRDIYKLHIQMKQVISDIPESKTLFLIINKIDLIFDKEALSAAIDSSLKPINLDKPEVQKGSKVLHRFSKIFFTSAISGVGVNEVAEYLVEQAKPGQWLFKPGQVFDEPLHLVVTHLVRSRLMNILPHEIPYLCKYEVDYLKENELGEFICVCLITCTHRRHVHLITSGKHGSLRLIAKQLESDLYKILGKALQYEGCTPFQPLKKDVLRPKEYVNEEFWKAARRK